MPSSVPEALVVVAAVTARASPKSATLTDAVLAEDDVLGLDVAVDEARVVGGGDRLEDRVEQVEGGARRERSLGGEHVAQGAPRDVLHGQEHRREPVESSSPWS